MQATGADPTFGELVRERRIPAQMTQAALCDRAGISTRALQDLERGVSQPHCDTVLRLGAALGLPAEAQAALLQAAVPRPRRRPQARLAVLQRVHNLPHHLTGLIGRERELDELTTLLTNNRLVCLTGAGGVGKTRLAVAATEQHGERFADGPLFVDLAPVRDPTAVPQTVARTRGVREHSHRVLTVHGIADDDAPPLSCATPTDLSALSIVEASRTRPPRYQPGSHLGCTGGN